MASEAIPCAGSGPYPAGPSGSAGGEDDAEGLLSLWDGMRGDVWILFPSVTKERLVASLTPRLQRVVGSQSSDPEYMAKLIAYWHEASGAQLVPGDVSAIQHVTSVLDILCPGRAIHYGDVWRMSVDWRERPFSPEALRVLTSNVILIGSPAANPATEAVLEQAEMQWLFCSKGDGLQLHRFPQDPEPFTQGENTDAGVFVHGVNPFNDGTRFYACMGVWAWGTQGAAALACSAGGANELMRRLPDRSVYGPFARALGYVEVWSPEGPLEAVGPHSLFQLRWPQPEGKVRANPSAIADAVKVMVRPKYALIIVAFLLCMLSASLTPLGLLDGPGGIWLVAVGLTALCLGSRALLAAFRGYPSVTPRSFARLGGFLRRLVGKGR